MHARLTRHLMSIIKRAKNSWLRAQVQTVTNWHFVMSTRGKTSIHSLFRVLTSTIEIILNVLLPNSCRNSAFNRYGNAITHSKSWLGIYKFFKLVKDPRARGLNNKRDGIVRAMQHELIDSMSTENPKEKILFHIIKLICEYNTHLNKVRDKKHTELLVDIQSTSSETVVATMIELSIIIEENISIEMKGKKGSITHDRWIRNGPHFVALMSCYIIDWGVEEDRNKIKKPDITLISCSTFLHYGEVDDEDAGT